MAVVPSVTVITYYTCLLEQLQYHQVNQNLSFLFLVQISLRKAVLEISVGKKIQDLGGWVILVSHAPRGHPPTELIGSVIGLQLIWVLVLALPYQRRRQWHPTPVLLAGNSHGWRSLVGCSPWGREESDMTERLHFTCHFHALEKEMATHSCDLAWRIPGTEEPGGLPSMGSLRVGHD